MYAHSSPSLIEQIKTDIVKSLADLIPRDTRSRFADNPATLQMVFSTLMQLLHLIELMVFITYLYPAVHVQEVETVIRDVRLKMYGLLSKYCSDTIFASMYRMAYAFLENINLIAIGRKRDFEGLRVNLVDTARTLDAVDRSASMVSALDFAKTPSQMAAFAVILLNTSLNSVIGEQIEQRVRARNIKCGAPWDEFLASYGKPLPSDLEPDRLVRALQGLYADSPAVSSRRNLPDELVANLSNHIWNTDVLSQIVGNLDDLNKKTRFFQWLTDSSYRNAFRKRLADSKQESVEAFRPELPTFLGRLLAQLLVSDSGRGAPILLPARFCMLQFYLSHDTKLGRGIEILQLRERSPIPEYTVPLIPGYLNLQYETFVFL